MSLRQDLRPAGTTGVVGAADRLRPVSHSARQALVVIAIHQNQIADRPPAEIDAAPNVTN
jgi:hypothetical protein